MGQHVPHLYLDDRSYLRYHAILGGTNRRKQRSREGWDPLMPLKMLGKVALELMILHRDNKTDTLLDGHSYSRTWLLVEAYRMKCHFNYLSQSHR